MKFEALSVDILSVGKEVDVALHCNVFTGRRLRHPMQVPARETAFPQDPNVKESLPVPLPQSQECLLYWHSVTRV